MKKRCNNCVFLNNQNICLLDRCLKPGPFDTVCEKHRSDVPHCDSCSGLLIAGGVLTETPEGWKLICNDCYSKLGTCTTCTVKCGVQEDNSGIPKQVQQTQQYGYMAFTGEVINPQLVQKYCPTCKCQINNQCMRNSGPCNNYNGII